MARMRNDDMADVLAGIANVLIDADPMLPAALVQLKVAELITDFVESRPPNFQLLYDSKLHIKEGA